MVQGVLQRIGTAFDTRGRRSVGNNAERTFGQRPENLFPPKMTFPAALWRFEGVPRILRATELQMEPCLHPGKTLESCLPTHPGRK